MSEKIPFIFHLLWWWIWNAGVLLWWYEFRFWAGFWSDDLEPIFNDDVRAKMVMGDDRRSRYAKRLAYRRDMAHIQTISKRG